MIPTSNLLYTEKQIRQLDDLAKQEGIDGDELMLRAGVAAFHLLMEMWPETKSLVLFCGSGNNGGDGCVVARLAHEAGIDVKVRHVGRIDCLQNEALNAYQACLRAQIDIQPFCAKEKNLEADVFVDALLGIGLKGKVKENVAKVIHFINLHAKEVLSLDVPSGLQANTGVIEGEAVLADATITFIGIKQGLVTGDADNCCGEIFCDNLELPEQLFSQVDFSSRLILLDEFQNHLSPRIPASHKGNFGHVLVVGGDHAMSGAPRLAAMGALRSGAGLTTIATQPEHAVIMNIYCPELMSYGVATEKDLKPLLDRASVVVLGPGFGQSKWSKELFRAVLKTELPTIIDADALNLLAQSPEKHDKWILTPHPGEAARLLNTTVRQIQQDRFGAVIALQKKYGGVTVLKGNGTIVFDQYNAPAVCAAGNPGMASGGMGDLLSGIIGGLVAQGLLLWEAAACGVCVHAEAADLAAEEGQRGMLAGDLLPFVRELVNQ